MKVIIYNLCPYFLHSTLAEIAIYGLCNIVRNDELCNDVHIVNKFRSVLTTALYKNFT